ncbi:MAG: prepilin-type cleavage/methylation domain-containing protein, partial [Gemmatimonadetes bacterium]|nr:prepilin-type cleavage/methylation domain-containing protein [Gemmatimonadota bacterium]
GGGGGGPPSCSPRKNRFLVPLNSDFDLYSKGLDGTCVSPLTGATSQDDIVRANDGGFFGLGRNF